MPTGATFEVKGGARASIVHTARLREVKASLDRHLRLAMALLMDQAVIWARERAPVATRNLVRSIRKNVRGQFTRNTLTGEISSALPHATYQEFGTGKHGPKGRSYEIRPKFRKALRWEAPGGFAFAKKVIHPGVEARPFMQPAIDRVAEELADKVIGDAVAAAFAGL